MLRTKLNVRIKDVRIQKMSKERGVEVLVIFNRPDLINPNNKMCKRYKITTQKWRNILLSDFNKIGVSLTKHVEEEIKKAIGKSVLITYIDKGNNYSNIFFEGAGIDEHYKQQSIDEVLEEVAGDDPPPPPPDDSPFTDEDEDWLKEVF